MPQVSDQDAAELKRLKHVEATVLRNPTVKRKFFELYKEADPNAVIPELEQAQAAEAVAAERNKKLEEEVKEIRTRQLERDAAESNQRQRDRLTRPPFNLSVGEIDEVISYQAEAHKNGELISLETAARAWIQMNTIPGQRNQPRLSFSTRNNRPKNDFRKALKDPKSDLFKDPRGYVAAQAEEAREELREAFGEVLV